MSRLPAPNLDDRRFQNLVDDAKRLVQQRCPEWTDHNVSDPGVTLIEAVATMVDQLLYRLNRVPEKNYLTFLDLIGVRLHPPTAARTDVTFWLSAPQPDPVRVRAGTEVATVRTETTDAVVFTTARDLEILPCGFTHLATAPAGGAATDRSAELVLNSDIPCFAATPTPGDALYVGVSHAVPGCVVVLSLDCRVDGVGVNPQAPPLVWEAWDGTGWVGCEVERDGTKALNTVGEVLLHVPGSHTTSTVAGLSAGWLRCRLIPTVGDQKSYTASPTVRAASAYTIGGTVEATHAETVREEVLGLSEGVPGQRFHVDRPPIVADDDLVVETAEGSGWSEWTVVEDFAESTPEDRHLVIDANSGEVGFGPAVREPDGGVRHYGAVPPKGTPIRVRSYRTGGGHRGNVGAGALRTLRSAQPFVARVENRRAALGGVDGETVEDAMVRGPMTLRTLRRAVVAHDYEQLARDIAPEVARVRCVRADVNTGDDGEQPGGVRLLVVPAIGGDAQGRLRFAELTPPRETLERIRSHLEDRRPLGTRLMVQPPYYQGVTVVASIQARRGARLERLRGDTLAALYRYFNPLTGGPDRTGWPFGRPVQAGEAFSVLQQVSGVDIVEDVRLYPADPDSGSRSDPVARIELGPNALVFSYEHQIRVRGN